MSENTLTAQDVQSLLNNPSEEVRTRTAVKVSTHFRNNKLTDGEREMAEEIFRLLVNDTDVRVREALSEVLAKAPGVPRDVALALAHDVSTVSLPVIRSSDMLTDEDLLRLISDNDTEKKIAVADREGLSENVADALVSVGDKFVVSRVVKNDSAKISPPTLQTALDRFGETDIVRNAVLSRPRVPPAITAALINIVSDNILQVIAGKPRISQSVLMDMVMYAREQMLISVSADSDESQLWELVTKLHERGRLTPSIILRAICMGDLQFFETAITVQTGLPIDNVVRLIYDPGSLGIQAICKKAGLPDTSHIAVVAALKIASERELAGDELNREQFAKRMIERVLTQYGDLGVNLENNDLDYLLAKIGFASSTEHEGLSS